MNVIASHPSKSPGRAAPVASRFVESARDLADLFEREAPGVEAASSLTPPVVDALRDTGLFWMGAPREVGGGGASLVEVLAATEEISRADGSIGWSFMANANTAIICGTMLGDRAIDQLYGGARMAVTAGMLGPVGKARTVEGGYRVGGKFAFGSGSGHADWIGGGMTVMDGDAPHLLPTGAPEVRVCFVPRDTVEMLGNWNVTGLVGTGSYDYRILDQVVPEDFAFERNSLEPRRGGARFSGGMHVVGSLGHVGVALGLMTRGLQEIAEIAATKKRPAQTRVIGESEQFRYEFGMNEASFLAARALSYQVFADIDEAGDTGRPVSLELRARHRQVTTWMHRVAEDVVGFCHRWAGSEAVRAHTPMSRVSRDLRVATQHVWVDAATVSDNAPLLMQAWRKS